MAKGKKTPLRKCVGCGRMKEKKELLRVLKTQDGSVILDLTGRANGRGAYLCKDRDCLMKAVRTRSLQKSLSVPVEEDVLRRLEKEMEPIEQ